MTEQLTRQPTAEILTANNETMRERIERLEMQFPRIRTIELPEGTLEQYGLTDLPAGVGVMGGLARAILQKLEFDEDAPVRDIDLVAIKDFYQGDDKTLHDLSQLHMPDDNKYSYGVKKEAIDQYFATRDFTFNEVIVLDGKIITEQGHSDLRDKVIRPTEYESERWPNGIGPKIWYKAKLMEAVFEDLYCKGSSEGYKPPYEDMSSDFYMALALNKAFQYGGDVPRIFLDKFDWTADDDPFEVAKELAECCGFEFRGSAVAYDANRIVYGYNVEEIPADENDRLMRKIGRYGIRVPDGTFDDY